ncbi:hypothetical protein JAAARDRAFT_85973, partial [Jaapia argillacea MUCL 33604]
LNSSPVPLDIQVAPMPRLFPNDWVVQDDITRFLSPSPRNAPLADGNMPLLRLKLTLADAETALGVSWNHSLGDASVLLRFMQTLCMLYREPDAPPPWQPTLDKFDFAAPDSHQIQEYLP